MIKLIDILNVQRLLKEKDLQAGTLFGDEM